jgi:hypothetical protein
MGSAPAFTGVHLSLQANRLNCVISHEGRALLAASELCCAVLCRGLDISLYLVIVRYYPSLHLSLGLRLQPNGFYVRESNCHSGMRA